MIDIEGLTMRYGDLLALDDLNLSVRQGEFFAFLGPNGAGKTTAIKLLTGLLKPTSGKVRICGHDIQTHPMEAKSLLGYVPDVAVFYEKLTPIEFMQFIADLYEMETAQAAASTEDLFTKFALMSYAQQRIENLSHGTRQRLAIASALLHNPKVFVIDEPMVGLDPIHARTVKQEIKARSQAGMTVLMSTHLLNIAEELADRIAILHEGRLIALGTMDELRHLHANKGQRLEEIFLGMVTPETSITPSRMKPTTYIFMGVCGSGKSLLGAMYAQAEGGIFEDADDFHPPENVAKMSAGIPLTDEDRAPWYAILRARILEMRERTPCYVLACSALKSQYRLALRGENESDPIVFIYLEGDMELIRARMSARKGHYMPPSLVDSQFAILEAPQHAITVSIDQSPEAILKDIQQALRGSSD